METKKVKKKKFTLKKVKKALVEIFKEIGLFFKGLYDKFMALSAKTRKVIYVWTGVVVILLVIIVASSFNNKYLYDYQEIEKSMNDAALSYVKENKLYPIYDNKLKIDLNYMLDEKVIPEDYVTDKTCGGFSLVYYDDQKGEYFVNSFINCNKYTTPEYNDYK